MSGKRKKPVRRKNELPLDRPFDPAILARASELARQYRLVLEPEKDLGFMGHCMEFPHAWGDGRTPDKCVAATREAIISAVATMLEMGEAPPLPCGENQRCQQINIRVTGEEKFVLEEAAHGQGFRSVSDFIRSASLSKAR
jgi:predicted RNase H-like HicB family nuclease